MGKPLLATFQATLISKVVQSGPSLGALKPLPLSKLFKVKGFLERFGGPFFQKRSSKRVPGEMFSPPCDAQSPHPRPGWGLFLPLVIVFFSIYRPRPQAHLYRCLLGTPPAEARSRAPPAQIRPRTRSRRPAPARPARPPGCLFCPPRSAFSS